MDQNNAVLLSDVSINKNHAKLLAMFVLGVGSFFFGILPALSKRRNPLLVSVMLCFGAGVLLATALVHMLPEVSRSIILYLASE